MTILAGPHDLLLRRVAGQHRRGYELPGSIAAAGERLEWKHRVAGYHTAF